MIRSLYKQICLVLICLGFGSITDITLAQNNAAVIQGNVSTTVNENLPSSTTGASVDSLRLSRPGDGLNGEANSNGLNGETDSSGLRLTPPITGNLSQSTLKANDKILQVEVSKQELKMLGEHDVTLLIDKSGSMDTNDCPPPNKASKMSKYLSIPLMLTIGTNPFLITRWHWCQIQTMHFADLAQNYLDNGMTVVLFSSNFKVFDNVHFNDIETIFKVNHPGGGTNTTAALVSVIRHYFDARLTNSNVKPLVIAIITDGVPDNPYSLKRAIIEATYHMRNPNEISIAILQIGGSFFGYNFLKELDYGLVAQGAKYDIVSVKTFGLLEKIGLARGFVDAIEDNQKANQP